MEAFGSSGAGEPECSPTAGIAQDAIIGRRYKAAPLYVGPALCHTPRGLWPAYVAGGMGLPVSTQGRFRRPNLRVRRGF